MSTKRTPTLRPNALRRTLLAGIVGAPWVRTAGAAPSNLVVAQVAPFSGPVAYYANQVRLGATVAFSAHNDTLNAGSPKITLLHRDDGLDPARTVSLYREVARDHKPLAFMYPVSPPCVEAIQRGNLPQELGVSLLGSIPSVDKWRKTIDPFVFHVGLGAESEFRKIIEHANTIGFKNLGVTYWSTPDGELAIQAMVTAMTALGMQMTASLPVAPGGKGDIRAVVNKLLANPPSALVCFLPVNEAAEVVRGLRESASRIFIYGPSFLESRTLYQMAGKDHAAGVGLSQYLPNPYNTLRPLSARYQLDFKKYAPPTEKIGSVSYEGYVAGRILIEAIGRAGRDPTARKVRDALESFNNFDLGGLSVSYSPTNHVGLKFIDLAVVGSSGRLIY
jgi:ABC-type branched-subunit amino acid transport system substrate-binding protein